MDRRCSLLGRLLGPLGPSFLLVLLLLLDGSVVFQTHAVDVEVKDHVNVTCLIAKWKMNITVIYETRSQGHKEATFTLPDELTYDGSTCGNETFGPVLAMQFGEGNTWMIAFDKTKDSYQGNITLVYNTDDVNLFPDAVRKGPRTAVMSYPDHPIPLKSTYSCDCTTAIESDNVVQTFWNVTMQAYVENDTLSDMTVFSLDCSSCQTEHRCPSLAQNAVNLLVRSLPDECQLSWNEKRKSMLDMVTQCHEDKAAVETTPIATTVVVAAATTHRTTTKTTRKTTTTTERIRTTVKTTTKMTTLPPRPLPTVTPDENPGTGNYFVKSNGTTCLMANLGLQLNISRETEGCMILNINPNTTVVNGTCGNKTATLHMNDANITMIDFNFDVTEGKTGKFYLKGVNITVVDAFHKTQIHAENGSLNEWKAYVGSSYMCHREQTLVLSQTFSLNIFEVWVQPFQVKGNAFATADECLLDDDAIIIPIAVGAALGALIVLIVIAYIIGRRKSQVGYQTL